MDGVLVFILLLLQSVWEGTGLFFLQPPNILNAEIRLKALFNCSFSILGGGGRRGGGLCTVLCISGSFLWVACEGDGWMKCMFTASGASGRLNSSEGGARRGIRRALRSAVYDIVLYSTLKTW